MARANHPSTMLLFSVVLSVLWGSFKSSFVDVWFARTTRQQCYFSAFTVVGIIEKLLYCRVFVRTTRQQCYFSVLCFQCCGYHLKVALSRVVRASHPSTVLLFSVVLPLLWESSKSSFVGGWFARATHQQCYFSVL